MITFDAKAQAALSFLISEMTYVEQEVLRQPYPEVKYPRIVPISTAAPEYADAIAFKTFDFAGEPALLGSKADDIPLIETAMGKGSVSVHTYALGYDYTMIEIGKAQELARQSRSDAINLLVEKPAATRQLMEQFLDKAFFIGDNRTQDVKTGLLNDDTVAVTSTGDHLPTGTGDLTLIEILDSESLTTEQKANLVLALFNNMILYVYITQCNTIFRPTHILLPPIQYGRLLTFRIPNTSETLISYLTRVLGENGNSISFEPLIHLTGRGVGGVDRAMVYTRDEKYVKGHMPMGFNLQAPATANNIKFVSTGLTRVAGTEIRIPKQHLYVDGI